VFRNARHGTTARPTAGAAVVLVDNVSQAKSQTSSQYTDRNGLLLRSSQAYPLTMHKTIHSKRSLSKTMMDGLILRKCCDKDLHMKVFHYKGRTDPNMFS